MIHVKAGHPVTIIKARLVDGKWRMDEAVPGHIDDAGIARPDTQSDQTRARGV